MKQKDHRSLGDLLHQCCPTSLDEPHIKTIKPCLLGIWVFIWVFIICLFGYLLQCAIFLIHCQILFRIFYLGFLHLKNENCTLKNENCNFPSFQYSFLILMPLNTLRLFPLFPSSGRIYIRQNDLFLENLVELIFKIIWISCCSCWEEFLLSSNWIYLIFFLLINKKCYFNAVLISVFMLLKRLIIFWYFVNCRFPISWFISSLPFPIVIIQINFIFPLTVDRIPFPTPTMLCLAYDLLCPTQCQQT